MGGETAAQSRAALLFQQAECPGAGRRRRRNSSATAKLPHRTQHPRGPRLICPSAARPRGGGRRERRRTRGSHACPPPSQSLFSSTASSLPGCLGGRAAARSEQTVPSLSAGRDIPSSPRAGDAARFHRVTPGPPPGTASRDTGLCSHIARAAAAGAELAAMHQQPHAPSHVYRSQRAGATPLLLRTAVFSGGISSCLAPGRSACSFSPETRSRDEQPELGSSCHQHRGMPARPGVAAKPTLS